MECLPQFYILPFSETMSLNTVSVFFLYVIDTQQTQSLYIILVAIELCLEIICMEKF